MLRSTSLLGCLCLAVGSLASSQLLAEEKTTRNVVLLVADDLSRDLGCYGNTFVKTPNLDALAKQGTRFTHAFATTASCSASRAVIYTGMYTHSNGQFGHAHQPNNFHTHAHIKPLPLLLKQAGYKTGIIGKLHVLPPSIYTWDAELPKGRDVSDMSKKAEEFIKGAGQQPFVLVLGYTEPHRAARGFGNTPAVQGVTPTTYTPEQVQVPFFLPNQPEVKQELAEYHTAVSRLDHGVGLVLDVLKRTQVADNTLVLFLSDNGMPFPGAKTTQYDPGLHLPLLIASPEQKQKGVVCNALVNWVDILPTILAWTKTAPPYTLPGRSLLPILEQEKPAGFEQVFGSHVFHEITNYYPMRTLRTRQHKYILNIAHGLEFPFASDLHASATWQGVLRRKDKQYGERTVEAYLRRPKEELYDLEKDPKESKNVANDPAYATVLNNLREQVKTWQKATKDPWLHKHEYE